MGFETLLLDYPLEIWESIKAMIENTFLPKIMESAGEVPSDPEQKKKWGYRALRPDDQVMAGTVLTYSATYATGAAAQNILGSTFVRVPNKQGIVHVGWYCEVDCGPTGYLTVTVNAIKKDEIPTTMVLDHDVPHNAVFCQSGIVFAKPNDAISWQVLNNTGVNLVGKIFPIAFIIGTKTQLAIQE